MKLLDRIAILRIRRRGLLLQTDSVVCLSVTIVRRAKTAEPNEMFFGMCTRVGLRNHVLYGVQIPHLRGNYEGEGRPIVKYRDSAVSCANRLNRSTDRDVVWDVDSGWSK